MYYRPTLRHVLCLPLAAVATAAFLCSGESGVRRKVADFTLMLYLSAAGDRP